MSVKNDQGMLHVEYGKDLSSLHYYRFPVVAERYVKLSSPEQASQLFVHPDWHGRATVLGEGSNMLLTQLKLPGWVISWQATGMHVLSETSHEVVVMVGAGMRWDDLVADGVAQGWCGLESLSAIPGTVGGAVVQNIGAYGYELADFLVACRSLHLASGKYVVWQRSDCQLSYRHSVFKSRADHMVVDVTLRLLKKVSPVVRYDALQDQLSKQGIRQPTLFQLRHAVMLVRQRKLPDPKLHPNTGSFFKNPLVGVDQLDILRSQWPSMKYWMCADGAKISAAWLIERCGLKGFSMGGVGVSMQHALVLVHDGQVSPSSMVSLMRYIQKSVKDMFDIALKPEVTII